MIRSMETVNGGEFSKELAFTKNLAERAGAIILENFGLETISTWKEDNSPLTQTDIEVNKLVISEVQAAFPVDGILGEEESFEADRNRLWVVDPIDGTQPFDLGMPTSTFCLALVVDKEPVVGVVYDPYLKRMYSAVKGQGAFLNGQPIHVSDANALAQSYVILSSRMGGEWPTTGQAYDRIEHEKGKSFNIRSIAYGHMMVATGRAVASVAGYFGPWDAAATQVILEEAGAKVTDLNGSPLKFDQNQKGMLVTNGNLHQQMLDLMRP